MALALTNRINTKIADTAGAISVATASFTPSNSSLLCVILTITCDTGAVNANTTVSGGSLTWTKRLAIDDSGSGYNTTLEFWTAPVATGASMTVTVANTANAATGSDHTRVSIKVFDFTGYDTGSPVGATASTAATWSDGAQSLTLSANPASASYVMAARAFVEDAANDVTATHGTGWTELSDNFVLAGSEGYACLQAQYRTGSTSTTVGWDDVNVEGLGLFAGLSSAIAIEIKEAGAATSILRQMMAHHS